MINFIEIKKYINLVNYFNYFNNLIMYLIILIIIIIIHSIYNGFYERQYILYTSYILYYYPTLYLTLH